ncbi:3-oxoadipyl-CoA thiolase [Lichenifustis flavocetrariae]|uniref:Beta-ketoadipyl-CoA thiolase n=1 Tax=Lichenifustis flavocetrariae TaxID=2949735 RepID=A0AA41Z2E6_9HYPH|nr:3-oxoadipyl-CoA thiolase [Lichenifustis flavocetrariae]MCW6509263.1 3-oxoadipyl-CoA thiolase [Lichenifustis flavocetrariae]
MPDAFIVDYLRTPIGRFGGALATVRPDDLAATAIAALVARHPDLDLAAIDEVILGCANQAGEDNRNVARMAALLAGLPVSVPGSTVNRLCGSGMDAIAIAARQIRAGEADLIVAGGVESMSRAPFVMPKAETAFSRQAEIHDTTIGWRFVNPRMRELYGVDSMPETGENVAAEFGVSREDQDAFALRSQERAVAAQASGRLGREITPVSIAQRKGEPVVVDNDEHPRAGTTLATLAKLPTPFRKGGTVTAGNASGVNDGAAALLIASGAAVERHGLRPLARVLGAATAGVPPRIMGMGPAPATRKLLGRLGLAIGDFDVVELNEAFASQALAVLRELGLAGDAANVNPNGGAIALGHPLGASGARITGSAAIDLQLRGGRRALATMCIGVGQGIAIALEAA